LIRVVDANTLSEPLVGLSTIRQGGSIAVSKDANRLIILVP
jgi:hypothetical protein